MVEMMVVDGGVLVEKGEMGFGGGWFLGGGNMVGLGWWLVLGYGI